MSDPVVIEEVLNISDRGEGEGSQGEQGEDDMLQRILKEVQSALGPNSNHLRSILREAAKLVFTYGAEVAVCVFQPRVQEPLTYISDRLRDSRVVPDILRHLFQALGDQLDISISVASMEAHLEDVAKLAAQTGQHPSEEHPHRTDASARAEEAASYPDAGTDEQPESAPHVAGESVNPQHESGEPRRTGWNTASAPTKQDRGRDRGRQAHACSWEYNQ